MKKALLVVCALALVVWVVSWFWAGDAVATSAAQPWPAGMGPLEGVMERYPPTQANDAAKKLTALGKALPKNDAIDAFAWREITSGALAISEPPRQLPEVSAMRALLLEQPVVWTRGEGVGGGEDMTATRAMQMTMARTLLASALAKARSNDASAWDDLHAVWKLARSLDAQPQMMSQTASFTMARMINAVAWKMPLPAPEWFEELRKRDALRPLLQSFQYQTASYWSGGANTFPTKWLANSVEHDRAIAESLLRTQGCDVNAAENELGVDLRAVWHRAFRYRAEREATDNALRIRENAPIATKSVCSDGAWSFDNGTLRFSREIASPPSDKAMPLTLHVTR